MGARREDKAALAPPLEFVKMTSYTAVLRNTLKFSVAHSELALATQYFSLKRREKKRKKFRLRLRRTEKWSIYCTARQKRVDFLKCR